MKYMLVIAYYLISPNEPTNIHLKVWPSYFETQQECNTMSDLILAAHIEKVGDQHNITTSCLGIGP